MEDHYVMDTQTSSENSPVVAYHEAGHAVAGVVLGVAFTAVRIVPGESGKIGVPLKTNPWIAPRPSSNPGEFTDEEWAELSQNDEKWEAWKKRDNDKYAIFCFAGKAAQLKYARVASDDDAKADYSFVERWLPDYKQRKAALERAARRLVRKHWPAVGAIATELLRSFELTPSEVDLLFKQAMPNVQLP